MFWGIFFADIGGVREEGRGSGGNNYSSIEPGGSPLAGQAAPVDVSPSLKQQHPARSGGRSEDIHSEYCDNYRLPQLRYTNYAVRSASTSPNTRPRTHTQNKRLTSSTRSRGFLLVCFRRIRSSTTVFFGSTV